MNVALYARYSSDLQNKASIDDQFRDGRALAKRLGHTVVGEYSDAAISGATLNRPGLQALLRDSRKAQFTAVIAESCDRFSRDLGDLAALHKRLAFAGVQMITTMEGDVSRMVIAFKGYAGEQYLEELGERTRRGQRGRVLNGKCPGGNSYGYDIVRVVYGQERGGRVVNPEQAAIVRRIYQEYAEGHSPKWIAKRLNREGVPGPRGRDWSASTIHGQAGRGTGILNNELYVGRRVWNRLRYVKDPDTRTRLSRPNQERDREVVEVPHLRIIDDALWATVKARQDAIRREQPRGAVKGQRPKYLLSGLTKCAICGAGFSVVTKNVLMCFNTRNKETCTNRRRVRRDDIEGRVLSAMRQQLLAPGRLQRFTAGYSEAMEEWRREQRAGAAGHKHELATVDRRIREIVNAISDGFRSDALRAELLNLEDQRSALVARASVPEASVRQPNLGERFRKALEAIAGDVAAGRIRRFIEQVSIGPGDAKLRVLVNLQLADAIDGCGGPQLSKQSTSLELVA